LKRRYRWLLAALAALLVLPIVAVIALLLLLDANDLRAGAERSARQQLGLPLSLRGDLHWSWWPLLAIDAGAGEIAAGPGAGPGAGGSTGAALLSWQRLRLQVRWRDLWNRQYHIERIVVDGLRADLQRDASGHGNWQTLLNRASAGAAPTNATAGDVGIRELVINTGTINYADVATTRHWLAQDLSITMGFEYQPARRTLTLLQPHVAARLSAAALPVSGLPVSLQTTQIVYEQAAALLHTDQLQLKLANIDVVLTSSLPLQLAPVSGAGQLQAASDSARATLSALGLAAPPTRDPLVLGKANVSARWRVVANGVALSELRASMDGASVQGNATWPFSGDADATFDLHGDTLNADRYLRPASQPGAPFELPVQQLRALRLRGSLQLDTLTLRGVTAHGARIRLED
jgi:AsmA protein